jgi:transposase
MPFQDYSPEQGALLPVHVRDVLTEKHLVFLIHEGVERQDLGEWEAGYSEEGQRPYHPALLLKVLLYGFALGVRSSRKLEQRVREDLGFRYLAGERSRTTRRSASLCGGRGGGGMTCLNRAGDL